MKKNENILRQLFDGEIYPSQDINPEKTNPRAKEIRSIISDDREYFAGILSESDNERFQNLNELHYEFCGLYGYDCYAYGFRLGIKLIFEALKDTENTDIPH
jgi:hypothetical protein